MKYATVSFVLLEIEWGNKRNENTHVHQSFFESKANKNDHYLLLLLFYSVWWLSKIEFSKMFLTKITNEMYFKSKKKQKWKINWKFDKKKLINWELKRNLGFKIIIDDTHKKDERKIVIWIYIYSFNPILHGHHKQWNERWNKTKKLKENLKNTIKSSLQMVSIGWELHETEEHWIDNHKILIHILNNFAWHVKWFDSAWCGGFKR